MSSIFKRMATHRTLALTAYNRSLLKARSLSFIPSAAKVTNKPAISTPLHHDTASTLNTEEQTQIRSLCNDENQSINREILLNQQQRHPSSSEATFQPVYNYVFDE
ncbi:hypothetical protein BDF20DRAFT_901392 [Mycotypha africana]|uniref:uncharacterized protein n=1 Tax=Mycotypha africana TaxID=64632 RepID=UPI002301CC91|nr:uncharacterized protein BDF20DRAFT_901392 [Mycotypha africana]KAI8967231.1 hypothetical protein BDF20DRAFT_901392 [Mycotypha africana]